MKYKVVAHVSYKNRSYTYVCEDNLSKREAKKYIAEKCYTTPTRTYTIEEHYPV